MDRSRRYMHKLHSSIDSHKLHTKVCTHKLFNRAYDYKKGEQTYGYKIWNKQYHQAEFRPNKRIKLQDIVADIISSITIHQSTKTNREQSVHTVLVEFMIHNKDDSIRFEPSDDKNPCHIDTLSSRKLLVQTNSDIYVLVCLEQGDNTIVRQQLSKQDIFTCVVNMLATPMYPNSLEQLELYTAVQELALSARNEFSFTLKESVANKEFNIEKTRLITGVYLYLFQQRFTYLYRNRKIKIDTAYLKQCIQDDRLLLSLLFPGGLNKKDKALIGAMATLSTNLVILLSEFYNLFGKNVFSLDVNNLDDYPMSNKLYCMDNIQVATLPITQGLTVVLPSTGGVVHSAKQHCFNEAGYKDSTASKQITFVKPELLAIVRMSDLVTKDNMLEIDEYFTFVSSKNNIMVQSVIEEVDHIHDNTLALLDREAQGTIRYYEVLPKKVSMLNTNGYCSNRTFAVLNKKAQGKLVCYKIIPEKANILEITKYQSRYSLDLLTKDEEGIVKFHKISSEEEVHAPFIPVDRYTIAVLYSGRQEILRYHQVALHEAVDILSVNIDNSVYSIVVLDKEAQESFNAILMIINEVKNDIYYSCKQYIKQVLQNNGIIIVDQILTDIMDLFIFYFKNEFIDTLNQSLDRENFLLHPRGKVDESELCDIKLGGVLVDNTNEESVVLKVDSNLLPVSLQTHKKRVCLVEIDGLFCSTIELFYQMVDREKVILVEQVDQVDQQSNNNTPVLLPRLLLNELQEIVADISSSITIHQSTKTNIGQSANTVLVEFMIHNKDDSIRFEPSDDKNPCHIDTLSSRKLLVQTNSDIYVLVFLEQGDNTIVREQLSKQDIFTCVVNMLATPIYPNSLEQLELYKAVQCSFTLLKESVAKKEFSRIETIVMTGVYLYLFQQRFTCLYRNRKIKIDTAYLKKCIQEDRLLLSLLFPGGLNKKDKALIGAMATLSTNLVILLSEFYNLFGKNVFSLDVNNLDNYPITNKLYCMDNIQVATLPITQGLTVVLPSTGGVVHSAKQHCFNEAGYKDSTTNHITFVKPELLAIVRMSDLVTKDNVLEIDEYFTFVSSTNSIMVQSVMQEVDPLDGNYMLALLDREAQSSIRYYKVTPEEVGRLNNDGYYSQHTFAVLDEEVQGKLIVYRVIPEIASVLDITQYKDRHSLDLLTKDEEGVVKFHKVASEVVAKMPITIDDDSTTIAVLSHRRQEILRYHQIKPHQVIDMSNLTTYDITYSIVLLDKEAQDIFNTILMIINQAADNHIYHSFKQYIKQVLQDNGIMILDDTIADIMDLFIFYFKHEFIDSLNQSRDKKHFVLHPRGKVDESELYTIELGDVLLSNVKGESVVLKVDSNLLPVSLHTHKKRVCLVELNVLFCSAIESFYQMVDRGQIILVKQVSKQFNNPPILLPRLLNVNSSITARLLNAILEKLI